MVQAQYTCARKRWYAVITHAVPMVAERSCEALLSCETALVQVFMLRWHDLPALRTLEGWGSSSQDPTFRPENLCLQLTPRH